jgi:hypothetical protein
VIVEQRANEIIAWLGAPQGCASVLEIIQNAVDDHKQGLIEGLERAECLCRANYKCVRCVMLSRIRGEEA